MRIVGNQMFSHMTSTVLAKASGMRWALAILLCWIATTAVAGGTLSPSADLTVQPDLSVSDDEATNVSGAACYVKNGVRLSCLLVGDEVRYARLFSFDEKTLQPGREVFLLPKKDAVGKKFKEADAEAVAFDDGYYYLAGSHGLNKSGEKQSSRYFFYRVKADDTTGQPSDFGSPDAASTAVETSGNLEKLIVADDNLKNHIAQKPGDEGVNIEGIAVKDGKLFVGFRGPVVDKGALIATLAVTDAFGNIPTNPTDYFVNLGVDQGIRDLAVVDEGFLILSGPQQRVSGQSQIFFWKPDSDPVALADLGNFTPDEQPEALLVVSEHAGELSVMVMEDGPKNGSPKLYTLALSAH